MENDRGWQQFFGGLGPSLRGLVYVPVVGSNLPTGNNDLYTVPARRKALIMPGARIYNPSGGNIDSYLELKVGASYYRLSGTTTLTTGTGANAVGAGDAMVLGPGESIAVNCATTAGLNIRMSALEFDASDTRLATARILALASGDNTLYTCPLDKTAALLAPGGNGGLIDNFNGEQIIVNDSGGSLNYYTHVVPRGGAAGSTNQLYPATAVADKAIGGFRSYATLGPGESLHVNSSGAGAGQTTWITYYEMGGFGG